MPARKSLRSSPCNPVSWQSLPGLVCELVSGVRRSKSAMNRNEYDSVVRASGKALKWFSAQEKNRKTDATPGNIGSIIRSIR